MAVVPFVVIYIVVLTTAQLIFIESIIATESIYKAFMVDSREEGLFVWHRSSHSKLSILVLQIRVPRAVSSHHEPAISLVDVDRGVIGAEIVAILPPHAPLEARGLFLFD